MTETERVERLAAEFWRRVGPRISEGQRRSRRDVDEGDVEVAVIRGLRNQPLPDTLTRAEQRLVERRLTRAGRTAAEIAALMGVKQSLVESWRTRRGQAGRGGRPGSCRACRDSRGPAQRAVLTGYGVIASVRPI